MGLIDMNKINIYDFLNKPNTLRNLTEEEFEHYLPDLAEQLSQVDYHFNYTNDELIEDWKKLQKYINNDFGTAAQTRPGMKLCEHFFPNFFDIKNPKGVGFKDYWTPEKLQKVIKWNRSSHSTPYLSEMRRGVIFCNGLTKNTMYRPHLAKMINMYYHSKNTIDPCCGWGGRLLGTVAAGAHYTGYEPNNETYKHLLELCEFLNIKDQVTLYNIGAENAKLETIYDLSITSPPYYNLEIYSSEETQSENQYNTYEEWKINWLFPVINNFSNYAKITCWNVANVGKMKLADDVEQYLNKNNYNLDQIFSIGSSARQANQNEKKKKKNYDNTFCYKIIDK